jgi:hypothetical protein
MLVIAQSQQSVLVNTVQRVSSVNQTAMPLNQQELPMMRAVSVKLMLTANLTIALLTPCASLHAT